MPISFLLLDTFDSMVKEEKQTLEPSLLSFLESKVKLKGALRRELEDLPPSSTSPESIQVD